MSSGFIGGGQYGTGQAASFSTPLPIPKLIDAANQGNAVKLKVMPGRHAFIEGKPTLTYGYSAPVPKKCRTSYRRFSPAARKNNHKVLEAPRVTPRRRQQHTEQIPHARALTSR